MTTAQRPAIVFPSGIDGGALLRPTGHSAWTLPGGWSNGEPSPGTAYRRAITAPSPLLFALTYFGRLLRNGETGALSFSPMHMDSFARARTWVAPGPQRDVIVAPRKAGKSILYYRILPLWALAHGHRRMFAAFSFTEKQARTQVGNMLDVLHGRTAASALLLADFPELRPVRGAGGPRMTVLTGGRDGRRAVAAYGMGETTLGLNMDELRPDLMVGDDIEPGGSNWTKNARADVLANLLENVLPMNDRAVVQVTGTVAAPGSVIHDAVRTAQGRTSASWVTQEGFRPWYYPAIVDEGGPGERSLWPQQWSLDYLLSKRYNADGQLNRAFALAYMNDPIREQAGAYWSRGFRYLRPEHVRRWVCWLDPALSTHDSSDHSALVVAGLLTTQRPAVVVAEAVAGHWSPADTRRRLAALRARYPGLQVHVEVNALGSEAVARQQYGLQLGDQAPRAFAPKALRIRAAADVYADDLVVHARPMPDLEEVLTGYDGGSARDDLPDALAGALRALLGDVIPA